MMCDGCGIQLPRGAAHLNESSCIEALKEALEKATTCRACENPVSVVLHAGCVPAEVANRGAKIGTRVLEKRISDWLAEKISGTSHVDDDEKKPRRDQGGHFEP